MSARTQSLILLHFITLIFGFTGIWGKMISLSALPLVWYRIGIAIPFIVLWLIVTKKLFSVNKKALFKMLATGAIIALHWVTFFGSIKASNVSVALATLSTVSLFTALLDTLLYRKRLVLYEIVLAFAVVVGVSIIFYFEWDYSKGVYLALVSAFLAALFTVINGQLVKTEGSVKITLYEMLGGLIVLSVYLALSGNINVDFFVLSFNDWIYLLLLGILATAFSFIISVWVMKELSPFTVAITVNLEPIYAIILAWYYFGEEEKMTLQFYIGASVILSAVFLNAYFKKIIHKA